MTEQPTTQSANPFAQFGKRERPAMGRQIDDPEKELRIQYNLNLRHREDDAGLWNFEARGYANVWLERNSCISPPKKGEIVLGVEKLNHPHTQDGFLTYMADIRREWEATKELAVKVNGKPKTDPFGKPYDPVKVAMRNHVNAARGNENDYDWRFDTNVYPRDTEVIMTGLFDVIPEEAADQIINEQMAEDIGDYNQRDDETEKARINTAPLVKAAITQGTDDPNPTQSPDEPETLADHFPRTVTGEPMPDKALINGKHWQKDAPTRVKFFADFNGLCNKHQVPVANHTRENIRKAAQGVEHLEQYPGTPAELIEAARVRIEGEYPLKTEAVKSPEIKAETTPPAIPTHNTPATQASDEKSSVVSGNEIKVLQETISALQKKINELESKKEPAKMNNSELPEAPFSANFHLRNKRGVRIQYTIRAQTVQDGTERVDSLIDILLEKRGFALDESMTARTASNGSPAPASSENGSSLCALIKVGKSYTGNKSQLQFECDGFDQPLRYTRDNLAQVLANAKQMNGNPFTSNDLTDGRKFGGEWMVEWKKEPGSDGKNHINVISVRNAA